MRWMPAALLMAVVMAPAVPAQTGHGKVTGTWQCNSTTPDGQDVPWKLIVIEKEGKLAGSTESPAGERPIENPELKGDVFSFYQDTPQQGRVTVTITLLGDTFEGSWSSAQIRGTVRGKRQ